MTRLGTATSAPTSMAPKAISIKELRPSSRVLIVEDEVALADMIAYNLRGAGWETRVVHDGRAALTAVAEQTPNLIILDLMLPELGGMEVAKRLRATPATAGIPILMLTAKSSESDELAGLAAGADDYVTKPFSMKLLVARAEALARRVASGGSAVGGGAGASRVLRFGEVSLDPDTYICEVAHQRVSLTLTEFKLLLLLVKAGGKVLSRSALITSALGPGVVVTDRTIDVHITSIRKKLGEMGDIIKTVRGVGYRTSLDPM